MYIKLIVYNDDNYGDSDSVEDNGDDVDVGGDNDTMYNSSLYIFLNQCPGSNYNSSI